ncbi:von Willebrand factor-like [Styela clava]
MKNITLILVTLCLLYSTKVTLTWSPFNCPPGQVYNSCGSPCNSTCEDPTPTCKRSCVQRCQCPLDKPFHRDGKCVAHDDCKDKEGEKKWPPLDCPADQIYKRCGSLCNLTCKEPFPTCRRMCVERCSCRSDKPFYHKGKCVKYSSCIEDDEKKDIHDIMCPPTQKFQLCGSRCNKTCDDGGKEKSCARICVTRCGCPYERPIWHDNRCIPFSKCPKKPESGARSHQGANKDKIPIPIAAFSMMDKALALMKELQLKKLT